jgi:acetyl esterase
VSPLLTPDVSHLPPTFVVTAEHDPLRDEGEELVRLLAEAGVPVVGTRYLGQVHGFWRDVEAFDAAEPLTRQVAGFLRQHAG